MLCEHSDENTSLNKILNKLVPMDKVPSKTLPYWSAEHYDLHQSKLFQSLSLEQQTQVIFRLNQWSLELIYFIEKFGLNYGAKMIELADSVEEKSLYTLFAGDEVRHRRLIEPFLLAGHPTDISIHPLLTALSNCLNSHSKHNLTFTIQVILEGFGLMHYQALQAGCKDQNLKHALTQILADEVNHHGMGVAQTKSVILSMAEKKQVIESSTEFTKSLTSANWVQKAIELTTGHLTKQQVNELKQDIKWHQKQSFKIEKIKSLTNKVGFGDLQL